MNKVAILAAVALAVVGVGCESMTEATSEASAGAPAAAIGAPAPGFALEDQTGKRVSLADCAGKIVVLEWINPDCPFVQRHARAKTMLTLAEKYAAKGVVWLGINSSNYANRDTNAKWVADNGLPYPVLDDHAGEVGRSYGAKTTPHMFVIDTQGKLVYAGGIDDDPGGSKGSSATNYVDRALDELLSGKPVSTPQSKSYGCSVKYAD
jgi:peroxiredoxin